MRKKRIWFILSEIFYAVMKCIRFSSVAVLALTLFVASCSSTTYSPKEFACPDIQWRPVPLWFWNNTQVNEEILLSQLDSMILTCKYGGCAILPFGEGFRPAYLSDEYMQLYGKAIQHCCDLGAQMSLYDEYGFPSGGMGFCNGDGVPRFRRKHPGKTIHRLDKIEFEVLSGATFSLPTDSIEGDLMSIVAFHPEKGKTLSLRETLKDGCFCWSVPEGEDGWKVLVFVCVEDEKPYVDYMDEEAVKLFVEDTHEQYYKRFSEAFGKTVTSTFFDEPTLYYASGRSWTSSFNEKFRHQYGFDPDTLYPALWYEMGEHTAAARNLLYGFRAKLYSEGFMKTIAEWAEAHGILSTGHQDQEEVANTTSVSGDLMLDGKYMSMPGIDKIGGNRPAENFYKVVSSSAQNWDHAQVMSETYGAMGNIPVSQMYGIAIEQYTKGITNLIPHAVWYDDANVTFLPELSWRNSLYNKDLAQFNTFLSRLRYILARPGRHVSDVAVLYPVQTLQGGHTLDGPLGYYLGGMEIPGTDYNHISVILTDELGCDFTYLHPEVLDGKCDVGKDGTLTMNNPVNTEHFHTILLPGVKVISMSNLRKIEKAWEKGANVIFTTQTPCQSADFEATDEEIRKVVERILSRAVYIPHPDMESLRKALENSEFRPDVRFQTDAHPFNYLHKVIEGHHVFLFGNIDDTASKCRIRLRENLHTPRWFCPHTGQVFPAKKCGDSEYELELSSCECMFLID